MDKDVLLFFAGVIVAVIGWFMSRKIVELEKADAAHNAEIISLKEAKAELRLHIAENYIKRIEIKDFMQEIKNELSKISEKIDGKADKN